MRRHAGLSLTNHGVWGERTDEISARFEAAVDGADALLVQGGINDIAQDRRVEDAAANLRALVARGQALGLAVAVADVLPWNNGGAHHTRAIAELNALIGALGVPVLPFHDTLEDPVHPGRMKEEWTNEDGDHPSLEGYRRLGEIAFRPWW
jgi:lysophospholipase L1-like esterase